MITILMAAYNGEKYIAQQIESILCQTEQDWELVVQDDCSMDRTFEIAEIYAQKYPDRIRTVRRETPSGSAQANFFSMLHFTNSEYTMFCDDDDVWLPTKIRITLLEMKQLEKAYGREKPLLVHTDLCVTDSELKSLFSSMVRTQKLDPARRSLNSLLVQNNVTGCTAMVNRSLIGLATANELPQHAVMHDWWFALIASALGKIGFVPEATILYRQHHDNCVGAKNVGSFRYNLSRLRNSAEIGRSLATSYAQAEEFLERFGPLLGESQIRVLREFLSIPSLSKPARLCVFFKNGFWKTGLFRKCGQLWFGAMQ